LAGGDVGKLTLSHLKRTKKTKKQKNKKQHQHQQIQQQITENLTKAAFIFICLLFHITLYLLLLPLKFYFALLLLIKSI